MLKGAGPGESSKGKAVEDASPALQDVDFDFGTGDTSDAVFDTSPEGDPFDPASAFSADAGLGHDAFAHSQLMGLGMAEAPPPPEIVEELYVRAVQA